MFAEMMSEMPLPMPRSVIWSPSHIRNMLPAVIESTAMIWNEMPGCVISLNPGE